MSECPFCNLQARRIIRQTETGLVMRDAYPVSKGHSLVIPKRHVSSLYELSHQELADLWSLVGEVRAALQEECSPHGFNIGVNDGAAAGQTVPHAHIHVIPRYEGDVVDPRGGVRWVVPDKARYWKE